jgi:Predicted transcriptional regulators
MSITINIADNLNRLRKERSITQDDLANFIGVSFQAVSKWERGDGYPDITILPSIANFYGVSLDELVGMNEIKNKEIFNEMWKKHREFSHNGKIKEDIELLREYLKTFPNDYRIMSELATSLTFCSGSPDEKKAMSEESVKLSERILEFCTDTGIRNAVQANICYALRDAGHKDRAIEESKKLPNMHKTYEITLSKFIESDDLADLCQDTIMKLGWCFYDQIKSLARSDRYSPEEEVRLYKKAIDFYKIIYDKGDFGFANYRLKDCYKRIADIYVSIPGKFDEAIDNLEKAAEHAIAFSAIGEKFTHESLIVNMKTHLMNNTASNDDRNTAIEFKNQIEETYPSVLQNERIQKILNHLSEH